MLGVFRYALSWMVVFSHARGPIDGALNWFGPYAVFSFYMISGYLMTLVLNERYVGSLDAFGRYLVNRFLRIYPPFWAALALTLLLAWLDPVAAFLASPFAGHPDSALSWVQNVGIIGLHGEVIRVIPQTWTLSVEVVYYLAMGIFLSRSRVTVTTWLFVSVIYTVYARLAGFPIYLHVSPLLSASLPFAVGATLYHLPAEPLPRGILASAGILFAVNVLEANRIWARPFDEGICASLFLSAVILHGLRSYRPSSGMVRRVDKLAGDLAYPVFLGHIVASGLLIATLFHHQRAEWPTLFFGSIIPVNLVALAIHAGVAARIEPLRRLLRQRWTIPWRDGFAASPSGDGKASEP